MNLESNHLRIFARRGARAPTPILMLAILGLLGAGCLRTAYSWTHHRMHRAVPIEIRIDEERARAAIEHDDPAFHRIREIPTQFERMLVLVQAGCVTGIVVVMSAVLLGTLVRLRRDPTLLPDAYRVKPLSARQIVFLRWEIAQAKCGLAVVLAWILLALPARGEWLEGLPYLWVELTGATHFAGLGVARVSTWGGRREVSFEVGILEPVWGLHSASFAIAATLLSLHRSALLLRALGLRHWARSRWALAWAVCGIGNAALAWRFGNPLLWHYPWPLSICLSLFGALMAVHLFVPESAWTACEEKSDHPPKDAR